jgi:hypothetical protein
MAGFTVALDIQNRGLQHLAVPQITSASVNRAATEVAFAYDKLRKAELRRSPWRFSTKRAVLRALTATTKRFVPPAWSSGSTAYTIGQVVQDSLGVYWVCMVAHTSSTTNGPGSYQVGQPQNWQEYFGPVAGDLYNQQTSYYAGELAYQPTGADDDWFLSLQNNNINQDPSLAGGVWWAVLGTGDLPINYLIAAGPGVTFDGAAQNLFPLPNGYLRLTSQGPRGAGSATLSTSAGIRFSDWQLEDNYIISAQPGPLIVRFIADVQDVTRMDDLYCEGLGARIAIELAEALTGSVQKQQAAIAMYRQFIREARMINWIELGATEAEEEEYEATVEAPGTRGLSGGGQQRAAPPQGQG